MKRKGFKGAGLKVRGQRIQHEFPVQKKRVAGVEIGEGTTGKERGITN